MEQVRDKKTGGAPFVAVTLKGRQAAIGSGNI
jgi:hypothetical protein